MFYDFSMFIFQVFQSPWELCISNLVAACYTKTKEIDILSVDV